MLGAFLAGAVVLLLWRAAHPKIVRLDDDTGTQKLFALLEAMGGAIDDLGQRVADLEGRAPRSVALLHKPRSGPLVAYGDVKT